MYAKLSYCKPRPEMTGSDHRAFQLWAAGHLTYSLQVLMPHSHNNQYCTELVHIIWTGGSWPISFGLPPNNCGRTANCILAPAVFIAINCTIRHGPSSFQPRHPQVGDAVPQPLRLTNSPGLNIYRQAKDHAALGYNSKTAGRA